MQIKPEDIMKQALELGVTNAAVVDVNNIETMLRMLQTTSPSYVLMASIENSVHWMNKYGEED